MMGGFSSTWAAEGLWQPAAIRAPSFCFAQLGELAGAGCGLATDSLLLGGRGHDDDGGLLLNLGRGGLVAAGRDKGAFVLLGAAEPAALVATAVAAQLGELAGAGCGLATDLAVL